MQKEIEEVEISISDLPIFKRRFQCYIPYISYDISEVLNKHFQTIAIEVIDVILIPFTTKDTVTSSMTTRSPKVITGNWICGYRIRGGKKHTARSSSEIETASNRTAYLCKIIGKESHSGWWRHVDGDNFPLVIITPDKIIRELSDEVAAQLKHHNSQNKSDGIH